MAITIIPPLPVACASASPAINDEKLRTMIVPRLVDVEISVVVIIELLENALGPRTDPRC